MSEQNVLLSVQNISKRYDQETVLQDFSLDLTPGKWIGILGESGSGKSTLLQIIGRFIDSDTGEIQLNGKNIPPVKSQLLRGHKEIKLVHQDYQLFPNQTVYENIFYEVRLGIQEEGHLRTRQLIEIAGLENEQHQKTKAISGGQKQRTAISSALALLPEVLLLDEPFAHLDSMNRARLVDMFRSLKSEIELSAIFVTHEPTDALDWADELIILKKGFVIQTGAPLEIYEKPINAYVAELTGKVNWINPTKSACIRPEKVRGSKNANANYNEKATVTSVHYRGIHWEFIAETEEQLRFTFYRLRNDFTTGDPVYLKWNQKDIHVFEEKL